MITAIFAMLLFLAIMERADRQTDAAILKHRTAEADDFFKKIIKQGEWIAQLREKIAFLEGTAKRQEQRRV